LVVGGGLLWETVVDWWSPNRWTGLIDHLGGVEIVVVLPCEIGIPPFCAILRLQRRLRGSSTLLLSLGEGDGPVLELLEGVVGEVVEAIVGELIEVHGERGVDPTGASSSHHGGLRW
jgi:hypothetical protein